MTKVILHLCADIGSDSRYYELHKGYRVIKVGQDIGVENYHPPKHVHGIIANPVCTDFSTANRYKDNNYPRGMVLVDHCLRIIEEAQPSWWLLENPATGTLKKYLGKPKHTYQPWEFGSPWTKRTALWGEFAMPKPLYTNWQSVPKNDNLYVRPNRPKPSLVSLHKAAVHFMPEYNWCVDLIKNDADLRSLCSDGFAKRFMEVNP